MCLRWIRGRYVLSITGQQKYINQYQLNNNIMWFCKLLRLAVVGQADLQNFMCHVSPGPSAWSSGVQGGQHHLWVPSPAELSSGLCPQQLPDEQRDHQHLDPLPANMVSTKSQTWEREKNECCLMQNQSNCTRDYNKSSKVNLCRHSS